MNKNAHNLQKSALVASLALLAINVSFLIWYLFVGYKTGFHSDSAMKVLLAREIVAMRDYFPDDWNYVNGDLLVLFGHTFIIPLLAALPAGYTAHALSGLISSGLVLSGIWFLTGIGQASIVRRVIIVAVMASGISGFLAENLYGQASYGTTIYFTCYIIYFSYKFIKTTTHRKAIYGAVLFIIIGLASWSNPHRALIAYVLPLLATIAWYRLFNSQTHSGKDEAKKICHLCALILVALALGIGLHTATISGAHNILGAGYARWLPFDLMLENISHSLKGYLAIFGGLPTADHVVVSKLGIYEAGRLIAAIALLGLIPYTLLRVLLLKQGDSWFLAAFTLIAFMGAIFFQITTTIPVMSDPIQSSRYLIPPLILLMVIVLMQPMEWSRAPLVSASTLMVLVIFLTSAYPALVKSDINSNFVLGMRDGHKSRFSGLSEFLVKNKLSYGYASYWNAGVLSVISDEKVRVRQILINDGIPIPMRHLSSDRWYRPSAWQGETFLLLTQEETSLMNWERFNSFHDAPVRQLAYENYTIYVFSQNLAINLPGWDTRYEQPMAFPVRKYSLSRIGHFVENYANSGAALVAEKGEVGALHFGPYVNAEPGNYAITFDVAAEYAPSGSVRLDIAAAPDQKLYGEKLLLSSDGPQTIIITMDTLRTIEFRVWALGSGQVVFKGVTIVRVPDTAKSQSH